MAWWTTTLGGLNLNDGVNFITKDIPEIDNAPPRDAITIDMADDYPTFVRNQPASGVYTINLSAVGDAGAGRSRSCTTEEWYTRLAALRAILGDEPITLTVARRGMPAPLSVQVVYRGMSTNFTLRQISLDLLAPTPVLA